MSEDISNIADDLKRTSEEARRQANSSIDGAKDKLDEARSRAATAVEELRTTAEHTADDARRRAEHLMHDVKTDDVKREAKQAMSKAEKLPDSAYLGAVVGSIALSLILFMLGKKQLGTFVGLWPPTILAMAWLMKERHPSRDI